MSDHSAVRRRELLRARNITVGDAIRQKLNVMHAVIMRDIRSRFFNHGLGFLIVPLFPVSHVLLLLTIYHFLGRDSLFGDDLQLFFATGLMPALTFSYLSRFMSASLIANKSMMAFPVVRLLDIVLARAFLEFMGIIIALVIMLIFLLSVGSNPIPTYPSEALVGFFFTVVLSLGFGIIASVITAIAPMFAIIYGFSIVGVYLSSGGPIYIENLPEQILYFVSWNPVFHAVGWIRSAYYMGYPTQFLDKTYLIEVSLGSVAVGLLMERLLRPVMLNS